MFIFAYLFFWIFSYFIATINKLSEDAMFKLEHGEKDSSKGKDEKPRIGKMLQIQDRVKDDYMANRILR